MGKITNIIFSSGNNNTIKKGQFPSHENDGDAWLGKTVITDLQLKYNENIVTLQNCAVTVVMSKNIVTTVVNGREGSIKEYIGLGDYEVTVDGTINNGYKDVYNTAGVKALVEMLLVPDAIEVSNNLCSMFGITHVVVSGRPTFKSSKYSNLQDFSINLMSDIPYELKNTYDEMEQQAVLNNNIEYNV